MDKWHKSTLVLFWQYLKTRSYKENNILGYIIDRRYFLKQQVEWFRRRLDDQK